MKPVSVPWMERLLKDDDASKRKFIKDSPYENASWFEKLFFFYTFPMFLKSWKNNGLHLNDVPKCPKNDEMQGWTIEIMKNWQTECERESLCPPKKPRLWLAMFKVFWPYLILPISLLMINECVLIVAQPLLLGKVVEYFGGNSAISHLEACFYAAGILAILITMIMLLHNLMIYMDRLAMRARSACCTMIYIKSLKLSRSALQETEVGQIINMMSNDVKRFDDFGFFSPYLIAAPVQMIIIVIALWTYLEAAILPGAAILILLIPFQYVMGLLFGNVRKKASVLTDVRLQFMSEIISGMRVLKMYTWEEPFAQRIITSRAAEIAKIRMACILKGINLSVFFVASRTILFVCFVTFVLLGHSLTPVVVFVTMSWLNQIRLTMTLFFPSAVTLVGELGVTFAKIQKFLLLPEFDSGSNQNSSSSNNNNETSDVSESKENACHVILENVSASWTKSQNNLTLDKISASLTTGDLLAIVGSVGAGKSSVLMALLNELPLRSGRIDINGTVSYAGQEAWNFNGTIRENILFGLPMDFKRYQTTVHVCALERDFELLPKRDMTLVGEKGVSLSGGQRARINLARAIYRQADCYLLDDPLSALDASVSKFIFEKCLLKHLSNKICILVTHQVQFVERATKIMVLNQGKCQAYGTFKELDQAGVNLMELLKNEQHPPTSDLHEHESSQEYNQALSSWSLDTLCTERMITPQIQPNDAFCTETIMSKKHPPVNETEDLEKSLTEHDKFLSIHASEASEASLPAESIESGALGWNVYLEYVKAGSGIILFSLMCISTLISQFVCQGVDIFLTMWTNGQVKKLEQKSVILIYGLLIVALFFSTIVRAISFFDICMRASRNLHKKIFNRLIRAPIKFFEINPLGRILNRFSKDLGSIDENFPFVAFDLNLVVLTAIGIIVSATYVSVYFLVPGVIFLLIIGKIRSYYVVAALDMKRFEAHTRSPIYSHLSTSISGLCSIRAFQEQGPFVKKFFDCINDHSSTWFLYITSSRALGILVDWCCVIFNGVIIVVLMSLPIESIPGGNAGLAISSGLALTGMIQWGVRQSAEFVSQMASVERIIEYHKLEQESTPNMDQKTEEKARSSAWPTNGSIVFERMCLSYGSKNADESTTEKSNENAKTKPKNVLNNIDVTFKGTSRIGIVGRTGAGKSSIINAIFRLNEAHSGRILIDGIDIQTISHATLRKKISIIPQEPAIFSGTVRFNLDPFNEYSDADIWSALEKSQLKHAVENMGDKLGATLNENGSNLSVGQRQLVCLARAILRSSKILILDEATANVDPTTDQTIQENIRRHFTNSTVITIAHRLSTIIDYHKILVLDAGEIQEFDTPYKLLQNKGLFHEMCKNTGEESYKHLCRAAKRQHTTLEQEQSQ